MSGAETPKGRNETAWRMFEADRASKNLGMRLVEATDGRAVVEMVVGPLMLNGYDIAHGGLLFTLADTAFACACNVDGGGVTVASGADVTFVAPAHEGDVLVATAEERVVFGRSGVYDVTVRRGEEIVAEFRGRSRTLAGRG
ncbi:hydroxyphenylacetyl-CoA thioesterase PaaI [Nocardiopsis sp. NPDC006832]|uniref:hydroxyphenylacetyl-CoA thioesterase PaaI n=1 Tax=Nocardiopsis sp. NPDC006832 TaxID=3157188 RepID=UPI0033DC5EDC